MSSQTRVRVWKGAVCRRILGGDGILGRPLLCASLPNSVLLTLLW